MCVLSFGKKGKQIKGNIGTFPINVILFLCAYLCVRVDLAPSGARVGVFAGVRWGLG